MEAAKRREKIWYALQQASSPITASTLAASLGVSRQVIVGDISVLRAAGASIRSSSRGYEYTVHDSGFPFVGSLTSRHTEEQLAQELQIIVDYGGTCIDVSIDHPVYGELTGKLNISSRYDIACFLERLKAAEKNEKTTSDSSTVALEDSKKKGEDSSRRMLSVSGKPLSALTEGFHRHHIGCPNEEIYHLIENGLREAGILVES